MALTGSEIREDSQNGKGESEGGPVGDIVLGIDDGEGVGPSEFGEVVEIVGKDEGEAGGSGDVHLVAAAGAVGAEVDDDEDSGSSNINASFFFF